MANLSCKLNRHILRSSSCAYSLPEVKDIWLASFNDVKTSLVEVTGESISYSGEQVTISSGITEFKHLEPAKNSTSFEDTLVVEDAGNKYRTHTLTFNISGKYDPYLHIDLDNISLGRYIAIVKTADGNYLMLGRLTGLEAETATLSGGGDNNGIQVVLSANVAESALPVVDTDAAQLPIS